MKGFQLAALAMLVSILPLSGCRMLVQQTISEVKGAQAKVYPVTEPSADSLARINSVQFEPCTTDTSERLTPSSLMRAYDRAGTEAQTKALAKLPGGPPTLTIRTIMWYFQPKGLMGTSEAIGRTRMYEGGNLIADLVVRSESESYRAGDEEGMAAAMVRATVKFLEEKRGK